MRKLFLPLLFAVLSLSACVELTLQIDEQPQEPEGQERTWSGVNYFAANCMKLYYLWADSLKTELKQWGERELTTDPFAKVESIRYKQDGKDYDRWTEVTDNFGQMTSSVEGISTTYGCDIILMKLDETYICAVVTVVYAGSPAKEAGLQRGDVIVRINGERMSRGNYYALATEGFLYSPSCKLTLYDGRDISMTAVTMYEDPVVYHTVLDIGGKKVGYLVYTSFTLRSINKLLGVFEGFRLAGVTELILDLRYNGGGYVTTEEMLASMLAPEANVKAGDVFEQTVYNKTMTDFYTRKEGEDALKTRFKTDFTWKDGAFTSSCDSRSGHLELDHLYAIIDEGTASASEGLLVGLMPYLDVTLIGQQTHGKFCTGVMFGAQEWYDDYKDQMPSGRYAYKDYVEDWGLYVMIGRYADCNGHCPAMPDGLTPDIEAEDRPDFGYGFGDERDPMLKEALVCAGRTDLKATAASTRTAPTPAPARTPRQIVKPSFGRRILNLP